jgi:hypothetical protein
VRARKDSLVHVDATLKLLDPNYDSDTIRPRRIPQRIRLFPQRRVGAADPGHATRGGHGEGARKTLAQRVRGNLAYQERHGKVGKSSSGRLAVWAPRLL